MYAAIVKALNDTNGPDISGKVVPMPAGSYHLVSKATLPFFNSHPDVFQVTYEADDASPAMLSTTPSGGAVITSRGGDVAFPGAVPRGMSWLTDTINAFDIYDYFVQRPNVFVDFEATSSKSLGTFGNPYNTPADFLAFSKNQDLAGKVIGFKRGMILRDEVSALGASTLLKFKGYSSSASSPVIICPYGDAEALPLITGERRTGAGTYYPWTLYGSGIYYISVDYCCHVWDLSRADGQKRSAMVSSLVGITVPGQSYYDAGAGKLYFMPWYGENPAESGYLINYAFTSFAVRAANVAAAGNVRVCGLEVRMARNNALSPGVDFTDASNITSLPNWEFYGNKIWASGRDKSAYTNNSSNSAMKWFGGWSGSAPIKFTGVVAGNEYGESMNNAVEWSGADSMIVEFNYGHDVFGKCIGELYSSCSNFTIRYNKGERAIDAYLLSDGTTKAKLAGTTGGIGVWVGSYTITGAGTSTAQASSSTTTGNDNHSMYGNLLIDVNIGFLIDSGSGHKVQQNTFVFDGTDPRITTPCFFKCSDEITGHTDLSNNIAWRGNSTGSLQCIQSVTAAAALPSGDNNVYYSAGSGGIKWTINGSNSFSLAAWKAVAAVVSAGLDQNSLNPSSAQLAWDTVNNCPGTGSTVIGQGKASLGLGTRYRLGNVRDDAAPTAGSEGNG